MAPYTNWIGKMQEADKEIVMRSLASVGMEAYAERTMDKMSDGECQRIMIARALAQDTPIILLDEPTSFLDMPNRYELCTLLARLAHDEGKCILFSTHELDIALSLADAIALIDPPRLSCLPTEDLHVRREPVLHAHHGESLLLQRFGDIAPPARQAAAVIPYDGREAFLIRRIIEVQPAHRVDVPVASGVAVSYIFYGLVSARPGYFKFIHASWLSPVIAVALAFGVLAGVLTWVAGPSKGIFAVGKAGYLPPFFQKTNKLGVQKNILLVQGLAVTFLSLLFVVMPSVQSFYQILSQLTVILYLIMYMLMFSGAIALRYRMKKAGRPFRIGKSGNGLMWFIGGLGFCGSLLAFVLSFIPPSQISTGNNTVWFAVLIIGAIVVVAAPFIIYAAKKTSWVDPNTAFEPFHWEVDKQVEGTAATATNIASETTSSASKTSDRNTVTGISSSGTSGKI